MALFQPQVDGTFAVAIEPAVRAWIVEMAEALEETIGTDNPDIRRLFPTAYPHDPERDAGYQIFAHGQQIERKHTAIETMRATVDAETFTAEELSAWMGIVNDIRLVLGTRLDVSEDDRKISKKHPDAEAHLLYRQLGLIMEYMVDALSYTLESLANLLTALIEGQPSAVVNLFDDEPWLDAQRGGQIVGADLTRAWVRDSTSWLSTLSASLKTNAIVSTDTYVVHDAVLWLSIDGIKVDMPCVVVGNRPSPDDGFSSVRIYHSTWPYSGVATERAPLIGPPDVIHIPDIIAEFIGHLESADFEALQAMFAEGGYLRPATGERFEATASEASPEFYRQILGHDLQAEVQVLATADDGVHAIFEYNLVSFGRQTPGVCIIERSPDGKIAAVRIADNANNPDPTQPHH